MSRSLDHDVATLASARLRLLCDAGTRIAAGGDVPTLLHDVATLAARGFADWCALDLLGPDRAPMRAATAGDAGGPRFETLQRLRAGELALRALRLGRAEQAAVGDAREGFLAVPIAGRGRVHGSLALARFAAPFDADDGAIAVDVARRIAHAIDDAQLLREMQEVRQEAEALQDVGLTLAGELDAGRVMHEVADAGVDITGADFGVFVPGSADAPRPGAIIGITRDAYARAIAPRARELIEPTLRYGAMLRLGDLAADPRFAGAVAEPPVRSFLAMPVISRAGEVVGGLFFAHERPERFSRRHEAILGGIAAQAAIALDNARLYEAERKARAAVERAVESLELNDERLQLALRAGRMGIWHWDVAADRVTISDQVERIFALAGAAPLTRDGFLGLVHEDDRAAVEAAFARALDLRGEFLAEFRVPTPSGGVRWVAHKGQVLCDASGSPTRVSGVCMDVTARKQVEQARAHQARLLAESNAELEQFAYIASHDLQEPLRMVTSYLALLRRRYEGRLDTKGDEFIGYAVDGAQRMMALINDLLAYSRAGRTRERPDVAMPSEQAALEAIGNLRAAIVDTKATIVHRDLPPVRAQHLQLVQLFQNLIGNAIKFRGSEPARVEVWAERGVGEAIFHVRDNGIGIAPQHHQRIFEVFQRLHARGRYEGTGIGLAICKKIVERVDGRIWVESAGAGGATFSFAIPD